jgi:hypothetical protein
VSIQVKVSRPKRGLSVPYRFKAIAAAWGAEVTPLVQGALKAKAPVAKENGGRLRDSIRHKQVNGSGLTVTFYTEVPYARYVLDGTRPHEIRPRTAKALHWKDAGGDVFAQVVNHPGTRPNKFPERAIKPLLPALQGRFRQISMEALGGE